LSLLALWLQVGQPELSSREVVWDAPPAVCSHGSWCAPYP
jgi:hypothetical protein